MSVLNGWPSNNSLKSSTKEEGLSEAKVEDTEYCSEFLGDEKVRVERGGNSEVVMSVRIGSSDSMWPSRRRESSNQTTDGLGFPGKEVIQILDGFNRLD